MTKVMVVSRPRNISKKSQVRPMVERKTLLPILVDPEAAMARHEPMEMCLFQTTGLFLGRHGGKPVMEKCCFVTHGVRVCRFLCFGWPLAILLLLFTVAQLFTLCVHILETRWACLCRLGGNLDPGISFFGVAPASFCVSSLLSLLAKFCVSLLSGLWRREPLQSQPTCLPRKVKEAAKWHFFCPTPFAFRRTDTGPAQSNWPLNSKKQQPHTNSPSKNKKQGKVAAGQLASRKYNCIVQIHRINAVATLVIITMWYKRELKWIDIIHWAVTMQKHKTNKTDKNTKQTTQTRTKNKNQHGWWSWSVYRQLADRGENKQPSAWQVWQLATPS